MAYLVQGDPEKGAEEFENKIPIQIEHQSKKEQQKLKVKNKSGVALIYPEQNTEAVILPELSLQ